MTFEAGCQWCQSNPCRCGMTTKGIAMDDDNRPFPIQAEHVINGPWGRRNACTIPWWLAEIAYVADEKRYGSGQTMDRIAERRGFGRQELLDLLKQNEKETAK